MEIFKEIDNIYWRSEKPSLDTGMKSDVLIAIINRDYELEYVFDKKTGSNDQRMGLGHQIGCHYIRKDVACTEGEWCKECKIKGTIDESFTKDTAVLRRTVDKNVDSSSVKEGRHFIISTNFMDSEHQKLMITLTDVTRVYQENMLDAIMRQIESDYMEYTFDQLAELFVNQFLRIIGAECIAMSILSPYTEYNECAYISKVTTGLSVSKNPNEFVESNLWLDCVTKRVTVIDNNYEKNGIDRVMICPIVADRGTAGFVHKETIGLLIIINKLQPYSIADKELANKAIEQFQSLIKRKHDETY